MSGSILDGAIHIRKVVATGKPFFIGRNGTIETEVLFFWKQRRSEGRPYPERMREQIQRNAGVFPATDESLDRWCEQYTQGLRLMDGGAAGWYPPTAQMEGAILDEHAPRSFRTPLRSLEPYYFAPKHRWTEELVGKKVAIISSFTDTIQGQITKPIWQDDLLDISGVEWSFIKTGYAPVTAAGVAEWPTGCSNWEKAVEYVVKQVLNRGAKIALIGCGGLGMIIAARLRRLGISSIVLGGSIQVLFGIKGRRWAQHDVISGFWNNSWVSPAAHEVPGAFTAIEGGCYW